MYEIPQWMADKPRRLAIEMLASDQYFSGCVVSIYFEE
jgi:hypothetical protein